jgi:NTP pyrophosphatase (non-canonical NTP hydrolase)
VSEANALDGYQILSESYAEYPGIGKSEGLAYVTLGLAGESGEVAEKVKKLFRDDGGKLSEEKREEIRNELGDVLWYVAAVASETGLSLNDIATNNIKKLESRRKRGVLQGSGDNR